MFFLKFRFIVSGRPNTMCFWFLRLITSLFMFPSNWQCNFSENRSEIPTQVAKLCQRISKIKHFEYRYGKRKFFLTFCDHPQMFSFYGWKVFDMHPDSVIIVTIIRHNGFLWNLPTNTNLHFYSSLLVPLLFHFVSPSGSFTLNFIHFGSTDMERENSFLPSVITSRCSAFMVGKYSICIQIAW